MPPTIHLALERVQDLRYGENPHQTGARYRTIGTTSWWDDVEQHAGMALSYLNLFDADAAWALVHDLGATTAGGRHHQARQPVRRGGGRHAGRRLPARLRVRRALGLRRHRGPEPPGRRRHGRADGRRPQADLVIAPGYADGAIEALRKKRKNTRVLSAPPPTIEKLQLRQINGGFLVQDAHHFAADRADWRVVTTRQPTEAEWADAELALRICGWVKSNSIVLVKDGVAWGIGAGQQNRVEAGQIAAAKAAGRAAGRRVRERRVLPVPRRHRGGGGRRCRRGHPARRLGGRREEHRQGRRARRRHGVHRRTTLPALMD